MKFFKFSLLAATIALLCSCNAIQRTAYMQDAQNGAIVTLAKEQQIRIKPLDRLTVVVSSKDPELAAPFNSKSSYMSLTGNPAGSFSASASSLQVLTVDSDGFLDLPIIGKIACAGKTRAELAKEISEKIIAGGYISDASVNIQFADMKIFVLGEVARPGQFDVTRDQITLLEALAMAGDMTIYGNRQNVTVVRNDDTGKTQTYVVNLLDMSFLNSPAYYLQQDDVVYVQPKKQRAASGEINQNRNFWLTTVSTLISVASLIVAIINTK